MFKFELKQNVTHKITRRTGVIYARAEYEYGNNSYQVYWDVVPDQNKDSPNDWVQEEFLA